MSLRIDTTEWIASSLIIGETGLGVRGDAVPSTGTSGAPPLYNDISLPSEAADEFRALLLSVPSGGTFFMWEDSSFTATGYADGSYSGTYEGFKNGVSYGTATYSFTIGAGSHAASGDLVAQAATVAGTALHPHTTTGALSAQAATVSGAALHPHTTSGALAAQAATVAGAALHPHTTSGALSAQDATVSGAATHGHVATGDLAAASATVAGSATHLGLHTTTGALTAGAAAVAGDALHESSEHTTTGSLSAQAAAVVGAATRFAFHDATGALLAGDASVAGDATGPASAPYVPSGGRHVGPGHRPRRFPEPFDPEAERLARLLADDLKILALLQEQVDAGVFDQP